MNHKNKVNYSQRKLPLVELNSALSQPHEQVARQLNLCLRFQPPISEQLKARATFSVTKLSVELWAIYAMDGLATQ